jgi:hypothetical protein
LASHDDDDDEPSCTARRIERSTTADLLTMER